MRQVKSQQRVPHSVVAAVEFVVGARAIDVVVQPQCKDSSARYFHRQSNEENTDLVVGNDVVVLIDIMSRRHHSTAVGRRRLLLLVPRHIARHECSIRLHGQRCPETDAKDF